MRPHRQVGWALTAALVASVATGASPATAVAPTPVDATATAAGVARPFGSHPVAPAAGAATPPGGTASADAATAAVYDRWKADYVRAGCGTGRYYVDASSSTSSMVVSEGQGYGMVITALMAGHDPAARTVFDGLYRYVLDHPSETDPQLMSWRQDATCSSTPGSASSATDGDLDIAFGLLLADTQWGSTGSIDYATEALRVIAAIKRSEIEPDTRLPKLGDWVGTGDSHRYGVRTSDLMVDHFDAFETATGDPFWGEVSTASTALVTALQSTAAPDTGLLPDFAVDTQTTAPRPASPGFLESANDGRFSWNACRTPWRLAAGGLLSDDDAARSAADRMGAWAVSSTKGDPAGIRAGYQLDGSPLVSYSDPAFLAPLAAGAAVRSSRQGFVDAAWTALRTGPRAGYYSDSLRLQVMLLLSNNSWPPTTHADTGVQRIAGADRFAVSAAVSATTFASGAPTVYVASGEVFPDALSASAAAGAEGAPVLLVQKNAIPVTVAAELTRLAPARIVLLGGPATVSASVETALGGYADTVERLAGSDRFAVSAAVSRRAFEPGRAVVYVASGEVFPDALSGSAAAGHDGGPVLLVRRDGVPEVIADELRRLQPASIVLLGGPNSVSESTASALGGIAPVTRVAGVDRFAVAAAVSARTFPSPGTTTVYVASGATFPDALSGGAAAISGSAPVLLVTRDTVPAAIAAELSRLRPARIVLLGGTASVSAATEQALRGFVVAPG
ncbi:glycosyl hydrolase family 8 [Herbiconiux sp. P18]|uniref:glycosyl hydrolase family 8 n=1 Tax=Herbiconiux liangxiaofengii TaxID=3342795 RepID=UPI0035B752ED